MRRLFFFAYACSGLAGLIYEVSWTRLLTLSVGHTTAAASAVVAAFLGGLALGAAVGSYVSARLTSRQGLFLYVGLETFVALVALLLPVEISLLTPLLKSAYRDGAGGALFPLVRLSACLLVVLIPATALGATFPAAIRWVTDGAPNPARSTGAMYALNTIGAALGALLTGFLMIPAIGISGSTRVGAAFTAIAVIAAALVLRFDRTDRNLHATTEGPAARTRRSRRATCPPKMVAAPEAPRGRLWLAAGVLGLTGFASLVHEIVWTRVLTLVFGPTIYAFAATLAVVIAGVALGSALGTVVGQRLRNPATWLAIAIGVAALSSAWTSYLAGTYVPQFVAHQIAVSPSEFGARLWQNLAVASALIGPTAICLGAAFPLALLVADARSEATGRSFGIVYAVNTIGAVIGSLAAGFVLIPAVGLRNTLAVVNICLIAAPLIVCTAANLSLRAQAAPLAAMLTASALVVFGPPWDRELLASGPYLYARFIPKDLDLTKLLKAGTLLYYREGAASTVSVKRLTGTTTLAVDGKVDASNRSDMLTQKLIAHLPLLLHDNPREICIIGLGSGVTVGAALVHPITQADVIEISPEVVEASVHFKTENRSALADSRTRLIVGDGRSHLLLSARQYDVIVSEPSNPWIAGVAALFTREFFLAARDRLAPDGIICQWAHTYNISDANLRSIVRTFTSVFPNGTAWLIGTDDVLLVATREPDSDALISRLKNLEKHWSRPGVADDLKSVGAVEPFSLLSLFAAGPNELAAFGAAAPLLDDDRLALEFSGPREMYQTNPESTGMLEMATQQAIPLVATAKTQATAAEWRNRAAMMARSDVHAIAYEDYTRALMLDPDDREALEGFVKTALVTGRASDALSWVKGLGQNRSPTPQRLVATSKLLAATGLHDAAIDTAQGAVDLFPQSVAVVEQLASLHADAGNHADLAVVLDTLKKLQPEAPGTFYYGAVAAILRDRNDEAARLA